MMPRIQVRLETEGIILSTGRCDSCNIKPTCHIFIRLCELLREFSDFSIEECDLYSKQEE